MTKYSADEFGKADRLLDLGRRLLLSTLDSLDDDEKYELAQLYRWGRGEGRRMPIGLSPDDELVKAGGPYGDTAGGMAQAVSDVWPEVHQYVAKVRQQRAADMVAQTDSERREAGLPAQSDDNAST